MPYYKAWKNRWAPGFSERATRGLQVWELQRFVFPWSGLPFFTPNRTCRASDALYEICEELRNFWQLKLLRAGDGQPAREARELPRRLSEKNLRTIGRPRKTVPGSSPPPPHRLCVGSRDSQKPQ